MDKSEPIPIEIRLSDSLHLNDDDINRLRKSAEDHFVERKSFGDWKKDAVKTVVAFANSLPIGQPSFLFVGVRDNGEIQEKSDNLDSIQKTFSELLQSVYPRIPYVAKALAEENRQYLAIIVHGSENRPHFAGPSYIREGSQSLEASEEQYELLIAQRQSKAREILKWKGRKVGLRRRRMVEGTLHFFSGVATLIDCNQFFVTLDDATGQALDVRHQLRDWIPLERIKLSGEAGDMLRLEIEE